MAVECPGCRTSLIGEVNRCWNCGTDIPPSMLAPASDSEISDSEQALERAAESSEVLIATTESATDPEVAAVDLVATAPSIQVSPSPFAEPVSGKFQGTAAPAKYPSNLANVAGASVSVMLGIAALVESRYFPLGGICTALVGLLCGLWGIQSNRRVSSTFGMVMCTIALLWSGVNLAMDIYIQRNNTNPFAPNVPIEDKPDEEMDF